MRDAARDLLRWYNGPDVSGRVQRATYQRSGRRAEEEALQYLRWCADEGVDPKRLILARHDANGWSGRVSFTGLRRTSERFLEKFRAWGDDRRAEDQLQQRIAAATVSDNTSREPSPLIETIRRAYQTDPDICMAHMGNPGYDPASTWCPRCPVRRRCYDLNWGENRAGN